VIGDFHEPYGAVLVGGIWYAIQSTLFSGRAVRIFKTSYGFGDHRTSCPILLHQCLHDRILEITV